MKDPRRQAAAEGRFLFRRFWRDTGGTWAELKRPRPLMQALHDAATLKYFGGGGHGCNDKDESFSTARRHWHHLMAYGFLLCFASTSVATIYDHFLSWPAPYPFWTLRCCWAQWVGAGWWQALPGCWMKLAGGREPQAANLLGADTGLLLLLMLIGVTGLLLLGLRATGAMGVALAVHLGFVLAFFVTMPYSKFVDGLYRTGALIRHAIERPNAPAVKPIIERPGQASVKA